MPILKVEGRIWHLARKINNPEAWLDNSDLRPFPEVGRKGEGLPPDFWVAENILVFGYRPYGLFVCIAGGFVLVNFILDFISFLASGDFFWFWSFIVSLVFGVSMVYYGLFSTFRRFLAFDRQRGLVHFSRPILGSYISVPWKNAHFMKIRWHVPRGWRPGKTDSDAFYFLHPPFRAPTSPLLSYAFRKQMIALACDPNELWWLAVHFMCHGPEHQRGMANILDEREEECNSCFRGDMSVMQRYVGSRTKVYPGVGSAEIHFSYGKDWKYLDLRKIPTTPSHVIGANGKWRRLKKHERAAHVPGPVWESLTPEQAEDRFEEPAGKKKAERCSP